MSRLRTATLLIAVMTAMGVATATAQAHTITGQGSYGRINPIPVETVFGSQGYWADMHTAAFNVGRSTRWSWTQRVQITYLYATDTFDGWRYTINRSKEFYISPGSYVTVPAMDVGVTANQAYHFTLAVRWLSADGRTWLGDTYYDYNSPGDYRVGGNTDGGKYTDGLFNITPYM
jgi:hypothetical protein